MADLESLLAARPILLADGGMGTGLFALGLSTGDSPELWNLLHPERVEAVHRGFVEAGSDIILTNSFGGTRQRLKLHHAQNRVTELNHAAARLARGVADAAGRAVLVAGSMGPTGELVVPLGAMTMDEATAAFAEQAQALWRPVAPTCSGSRPCPRPTRSRRRSPVRRPPTCRSW